MTDKPTQDPDLDFNQELQEALRMRREELGLPPLSTNDAWTPPTGSTAEPLTAVPIGDVLGSLFAKLKQKNPKLDLEPENCSMCHDTGVVHIPMVILLEDMLYSTGLTHKRACDCPAGREALAKWRLAEKCTCEYGQVQAEPDPKHDWKRLITSCPHCRSGKDRQAAVDGIKAARMQEKLDRLIKASRLTEKHRRFRFKTLRPTVVLRDGREVPDAEIAMVHAQVVEACENGNSLYLVGDIGTGKTALAMAYLNEWLDRGKSGIFFTLQGLKDALFGSVNNSEGARWGEIIQAVSTADLAVIDDLGASDMDDRMNGVLHQILSNRIDNDLPTVVTTNHSRRELREVMHFSMRVTSRLSEGFITIGLKGEDRRINEYHK